MAADEIRALSEALAADPQSLAFIPLAERLLANGDLAGAARVAARGAARHGMRADAHDLVARIALAQGDEVRAETAWETVLELAPRFGTAHRGLGLLRYRQGRHDDALRHLQVAHEDAPEDRALRAAMEAVRRAAGGEPLSGPSEVAVRVAGTPVVTRAVTPPIAPRAVTPPAGEEPATPPPAPGSAPEAAPVVPGELFDPLLGDTAQVALLLDADGFVTAGRYETADGADLGATIGAQLSGVSDEAERAMRHFGLGAWTRIVLETEAATVAMAPEGEGLVLVAAPEGTPLGFVRRTLERAVTVAHGWLGGRP